MSRKDKLRQKLFRIPAPKDFAWDDLIVLMRREGFTETCESGSHYTFEHTAGFRFFMSKTHPSGILKRYQIDHAKEAIKAVNISAEE